MAEITRSGVYLIYCHANQKAYVGSSLKVRSRLARHTYDLRHNQHANQHLQNAWNLYGEAEFSMGTLQPCDPENTLCVEQWWLDIWMASGMAFNRQPNAKSAVGVRHSTEFRQACSRRMKSNPPFKGRQHTDESKALIGAQAKFRLASPDANPFFGKTHTAAVRKVISQKAMGNRRAAGVVRSPETRAKISGANKGRCITEEQRAQRSVTFSGKGNPRYGKTVPQEQKDRATATRAANRAAGLHKT